MPLDVLGRTRATLKESACLLYLGREALPGNPLNLLRARDRGLQLFPVNEEFPVSASHQLALITSLPFVHTARRYYRLNDRSEVFGPRCDGTCAGSHRREDDRTRPFRGSKSRNKVSVGEPAEGSLPIRFTAKRQSLPLPVGRSSPSGVRVHRATSRGSRAVDAFCCGVPDVALRGVSRTGASAVPQQAHPYSGSRSPLLLRRRRRVSYPKNST